jgi:cob(I)alamin adenosyltransferase
LGGYVLLQDSSNIAQQSLGIRLSSHEKICAERMKTLIKSIDELRKEVAELKDSVSKGKGIVAALVFIGSVATAVIGFFSFK